jgi:hypothetical protein
MKERGRYQIQFMKTRNSSGVGQKVDLEFDVDTLRIKDLFEDENSGSSLNQMKSQSSNIVANIKAKSSVTESNIDKDTGEIRDPNQGITAKKLTGSKVGQAQMLDILGKINAVNSERD